MSNLQSKITALLNGPMKGQGWCTPEKGYDLALAVIKTKSAVTVEIGCWMGRSAISMALAHAEQKSGILWAIDPWSPEASVEGYDKPNADWWGAQNHEAAYQRFLANLNLAGVEPYVKVVRSKSDEVDPPKEIDVLNVDGQHTNQAIRDVERFASKVRIGGFCHVDDVEWSSLGPARAVQKLLTMGFVETLKRDTGILFQRTSLGERVMLKKRGRPPGKKVKKGSVKVIEP